MLDIKNHVLDKGFNKHEITVIKFNQFNKIESDTALIFKEAMVENGYQVKVDYEDTENHVWILHRIKKEEHK